LHKYTITFIVVVVTIGCVHNLYIYQLDYFMLSAYFNVTCCFRGDRQSTNVDFPEILNLGTVSICDTLLFAVVFSVDYKTGIDAEFKTCYKMFVLLRVCLTPNTGRSVSKVSDYGLDDRGSIPDRGIGFFL
jgi:hypothetical protein